MTITMKFLKTTKNYDVYEDTTKTILNNVYINRWVTRQQPTLTIDVHDDEAKATV